MKFLGIYFTGTGNTKRVCLTAQSELLSRGHSLDLVDVIENKPISLAGYDGLFVFYPIYAFNAPKPIIACAKSIKKLEKPIPCVIMKQSGEHLFWNNASSLHLISILKRRNILVKNEYHYLMPYSFVFRHSDYMAFRMKSVMEKLLPMDLDLFLQGKDVHVKRFFFDRPFAAILRIQRWGGRFNGRFYRVDADKCVQCMRCVKECPAENISFENGKFRFGGKCLMCQRCVMHCPKKAVKAGLFDSWRVDEPYSFEETGYQEERKPRYCRKNYQRYFEEAEKRIGKAK